MVTVRLSRNKQQIIIKISSPDKFLALKEVLNEHHFKFNPEFEYQEKVWTQSIFLCEEALAELFDVESFNIPDEIFEAMKAPLETQFFRVPFKKELLKTEPKGDYQIRAIKQGIKQNRLYLAHKMGLGKTYMVIGILNHLWERGLIDKILIIAPTESVINFKRELLKFATFPLKEDEIALASSTNRRPFNDKSKVVIMRYRTFLMISDDYYKETHKKLSKKYRTACIPFGDWGTERAIILDEAHMIKNRTARSSRVLHIHRDFFKFRYLLSGTPYPLGVADLYSQLTFLDSRSIPIPYYDWLGKIANLGNRFSQYAINSYDEEKVKEFLKSVDKLIIREFTEDNLNLPELITKNIYVEMKPKQQAIYRSLISLVLDENKSKNGRIIMKEVYRNFPRISLALDNPCILKGKIDFQQEPELFKRIEKWKFSDHSKLESMTSLLEKYIDEGKKVIIWSGHPLSINQLGEFYAKYNPVLIHGQLEIPKGTTREEYRDMLVESFKNDKTHKVLIASYLMIARAVNIVEASRSIWFDRPWNFEIVEQASKRNHRIGTTETVVMNPIIIEKTIEERQDRVLKKRQQLDKDLLKYDSLSKESWKNLFEGAELD